MLDLPVPYSLIRKLLALTDVQIAIAEPKGTNKNFSSLIPYGILYSPARMPMT
jgi:hypothetical protein